MGSIARREFLARAAELAAAGGLFGLCGSGALLCGPFTGRALAAEGTRREALYYEKLRNNEIHCSLCPLDCQLADGMTCFCRTRTNRGGTLYTDAYENPAVLRVDPIEKTPLHHFFPGAKALALGTPGCNLRCLYCQNFEESQSRPADCKTLALTAREAVRLAKEKGCGAIACTYTEPIVFYEYAIELAERAHEAGLRAVAATNCFMMPEPMKRFARTFDAIACAIKGITEKYYEKVCGSELAPVLRAIEAARAEGKAWLEVTTLVVPTLNDAPEDLRGVARWVRTHLGAETPLHFARFVPVYRLRDLPPTPVRTLEAARKAALDEGLRYVYISNVAPHEGNSTYCPRCKAEIVKRIGVKLLESRVARGKCGACGAGIPGKWT